MSEDVSIAEPPVGRRQTQPFARPCDLRDGDGVRKLSKRPAMRVSAVMTVVEQPGITADGGVRARCAAPFESRIAGPLRHRIVGVCDPFRDPSRRSAREVDRELAEVRALLERGDRGGRVAKAERSIDDGAEAVQGNRARQRL